MTYNEEDFTVTHYRELLTAAKLHYQPATYDAIPWGERFVLWRHDCDLSLNRAWALAQLDADAGITSTFFLNPHAEFYNVFERAQSALVRRIVEVGHQIGLHLDGAYYGDFDEHQLGALVARECQWLTDAFGSRPVAFSFHNPTAQHLRFVQPEYGGLVNCYAERFSTQVGYCSDSNGYWRYRRLHDVLIAGTDHCLQVLTHPGWWQTAAMSPRKRVARAVNGRAAAVIREYEDTLRRHGRVNASDLPIAIAEYLTIDERDRVIWLWDTDAIETLVLELRRLLGPVTSAADRVDFEDGVSRILGTKGLDLTAARGVVVRGLQLLGRQRLTRNTEGQKNG